MATAAALKEKPTTEPSTISAVKVTTVSLAARDFLALVTDAALFASTDEFRPALCHIRLEAKDGLLTAHATDSYVLTEATEDVKMEGPSWVRFLHRRTVPLIKALLAGGGRSTIALTVRDDDPSISIARDIASVTFGSPDPVKWPDIPGLLAKEYGKCSDGTMRLNPQLLALLGRLSDKPLEGVRLEFHDVTEPISWTVGSRRRGLIMPLRVNR